ncbi:MAG: FecR family protein [Opitutaceae bacterium]|jgi:hypothetical protein|nr:FecR family protein [Opitutaceae bacterium]
MPSQFSKHLLTALLLAALAGVAGTATAQQPQPQLQQQPQQQPQPQPQQQPQLPSPPAQEPAPENAARIIVVQVTGEVYVFTAGETYRLALRAGSLVTAGQMIATGPKASVMLAFSNGATVTIGEHALVSLDEFLQTPFGEMFKMAESTQEPSSSQTRLDLVRGELIANVKKLNKEEGSTFEVKTPLGVAGIRGTTFQIAYIPDILKTTPNAKAGNAIADFAIVMLEGTVEMTIPNRPRPIVIPQGKQLVLENIEITENAAAPALAEESAATTPTDASATSQAMLMQHVQAMLTATAGISVPGIPGAPVRPPAAAQSASGAARDRAQENAAQNTESAPAFEDDISPAPAPQIPAPRLSPTDGTGA